MDKLLKKNDFFYILICMLILEKDYLTFIEILFNINIMEQKDSFQNDKNDFSH